MREHDPLRNEWQEILGSYPPVLSPRQVQVASKGIIKANDVYMRNRPERKSIDLDVRIIAGRVFVTRESLIDVLSGRQDLPL